MSWGLGHTGKCWKETIQRSTTPQVYTALRTKLRPVDTRALNQYDCDGGLRDRRGTKPETGSKVLRNSTNSFTLGFRAAVIRL
jgi:hypothetical protein